MQNSIILQKTYAFSLANIELYRFLTRKGVDGNYVLAKQLLRSSTSIGANMEEAKGGSSKKDFIAKTHIAYKKARETHY